MSTDILKRYKIGDDDDSDLEIESNQPTNNSHLNPKQQNEQQANIINNQLAYHHQTQQQNLSSKTQNNNELQDKFSHKREDNNSNTQNPGSINQKSKTTVSKDTEEFIKNYQSIKNTNLNYNVNFPEYSPYNPQQQFENLNSNAYTSHISSNQPLDRNQFEELNRQFPQTNNQSLNKDLVTHLNDIPTPNSIIPTTSKNTSQINQGQNFQQKISTNTNNRAHIPQETDLADEDPNSSNLPNNNFNQQKFHHFQIIDEDVENFKRRLDIMVKNFRTDSLNDFMAIKRNLLHEQKTVIEAEKQKCESLLAAKTNQIENLKEALALTKQQLLKETEVKERLGFLVFKLKEKNRVLGKKNDAFSLLKSHYLFVKKSNALIAKVRTSIVNYNLKQRLFKIFLKNYYDSKQQRTVEKKEQAMEETIKEVSVKYNKEINDLRIKLNEANISIAKFREQRNAVQENLKKALMRGVVAMNFEAMNILDGEGELVLDGAMQGGKIGMGVGEGSLRNANFGTSTAGGGVNNNNLSVSLSTSQLNNAKIYGENTSFSNLNTVNAVNTVNNVQNNQNTNLNNTINKQVLDKRLDSSTTTNVNIDPNYNTGRFSPNTFQPNNYKAIDISSSEVNSSQNLIFPSQKSQINNNLSQNKDNPSYSTTTNTYVTEQLNNKSVAKDSNWITACSVPITVKQNLIIRESTLHSSAISGVGIGSHNKPEYVEDKPYSIKKQVGNIGKIGEESDLNHKFRENKDGYTYEELNRNLNNIRSEFGNILMNNITQIPIKIDFHDEELQRASTLNQNNNTIENVFNQNQYNQMRVEKSNEVVEKHKFINVKEERNSNMMDFNQISGDSVLNSGLKKTGLPDKIKPVAAKVVKTGVSQSTLNKGKTKKLNN